MIEWVRAISREPHEQARIGPWRLVRPIERDVLYVVYVFIVGCREPAMAFTDSDADEAEAAALEWIRTTCTATLAALDEEER